MAVDLPLLVERVATAIDSARVPIGESEAGAPRFALFHAANSICSQKVRAVLAHHELAYVSHPLNLFAGQTYLPDYVRLRMIGCERHGGALVAHHNGSTAASDGCDGVVVPTLVDFETGEVIVDSKRICLTLDELAPEARRLRPDALGATIDAELTIVDAMPNYQMLMGRMAASDTSGLAKQATFSERKVAWCDRYLEECAGEAPLFAAYTAKRAKELSAATGLFSEEAMQAATAKVEAALGGLEARLARRSPPFVSDQPTMADLFWEIELLRIENLGHAAMWIDGRLPGVEAYFAAQRALPCIRTAILDWPGALY